MSCYTKETKTSDNENFLQCKAHVKTIIYRQDPQFCLKTSVGYSEKKGYRKTVNLILQYLKHTCWKARSQIKTILLKENFRECS